jgi:hypothetical protein
MSMLELETRGELVARISEPLEYCKADREDHIALLLVQLMKASIDAVEPMRNLKGIEKVL